jgi:dTDP-glucose 4,6-dehydratase
MSPFQSSVAPQRILVTGGCGFIGSALIRHLVTNSRLPVCNIDKLTYAGDPATLEIVVDDPLYSFKLLDTYDGLEMKREVYDFAPDAIVHLAAESHVDRSLDKPSDFINTNVVGTFNLLEAALLHWQRLPSDRKAKFRFVQVSTDEVYGSLPLEGKDRFGPLSPYAPSSPYAASKAAADHLARAWSKSYGLPVIVSNCSNNYGPYQFPDKLIPRMIIAALHGGELPIYGAGANVRDWLYVDDHVRALECILSRGVPGKTYLIGGGAERRNIDLVRTLCGLLDELLPTAKHCPHEKLITFVADRPGHDLRYSVDDTPLRELGWRPQHTLESGLRATIAWYLSNRSWWEQLRSRYGGDRLGLDIFRTV